MKKDSCPFCTINPKHTIIVKKFKECYVCFSNPRLMPGHLLVIPYRHVERPSELTARERRELFDVAIAYQEKILKKYWGCDVKQNCRPTLKESAVKVNHIHIHVQPRAYQDELYRKVQIHQDKVFRSITAKEVKQFLKLLT